MTTFNYCPFCAYTLESPTPKEILAGSCRCPNCRDEIPLSITRDDLILSMCDMIGHLEKEMDDLKQKFIVSKDRVLKPTVLPSFPISQPSGFDAFDDDIPF